MSENAKYWIWLQNALGYCVRIKNVLDGFGGAKELYDAGIIEWKMSSNLTRTQVDKLMNTDLKSSEEVIFNCEKNNWKIIDYDDSAYPERLKEIVNPPSVLYVDGDMPDIDNCVAIGIVGTRKASEYSVKVAHIMSKGITEAGAVVVSGGALGIDTYAHKGALAAGGKTVAVLGCGFGTNYLAGNKNLRELISKNGALVTEFQPYTKAGRSTFPMRNRIISGLSLGVLVVEAGIKSGSLITANLALEQNRDVYAVPTSVISPDFAGTNKLISDGAKIVVNPSDLIIDYASEYDSVDLSKIRTAQEIVLDKSEKSLDTTAVKKKSASDKKSASKNDEKYSFENLEKGRKKRLDAEAKALKLKGDAKTVYDSLDEDEYTDIQKIIDKTGLNASQALSAITQLEILQIIKSTANKRYKKF